MNEAKRRKQLAAAISPENMQTLCITAEKAQVRLLSRVYGGSELPVLDLMGDLEQLIILLQEFDDSRTEN